MNEDTLILTVVCPAAFRAEARTTATIDGELYMGFVAAKTNVPGGAVPTHYVASGQVPTLIRDAFLAANAGWGFTVSTNPPEQVLAEMGLRNVTEAA